MMQDIFLAIVTLMLIGIFPICLRSTGAIFKTG